MSEPYQPELGQMIFGQPSQNLSCDWRIEVAIESLANAFDITNPGLDNPFNNSGVRYKWSCFEAHAYDWGDDEQPFNLRWRDLLVSWYKYHGRGMSCNRTISDDELRQMFAECMNAIITETPVDCDV